MTEEMTKEITEEKKQELLLEAIRMSFDAVFRLDLARGIYHLIFLDGKDCSQNTQSFAYAKFAEDFAKKYATPNKAE